jgi:2-phospho-L-lactate/phosphoenolpyruvate guanylyltransferase
MAERWTALIPFAPPGQRKTRLGDVAERDALAVEMLDHVAHVLRHTPEIDRVVVLSTHAIERLDWLPDQGRPLNAELEQARTKLGTPLLILFADLPLLRVDDVQALLRAAGNSMAIAPDRHGTGTNALAFARPHPVQLAFGPGSFARHHEQHPDMAIVSNRWGLACDVDTPADLALVRERDYQSAA